MGRCWNRLPGDGIGTRGPLRRVTWHTLDMEIPSIPNCLRPGQDFAHNLRVERYVATSSVLTMETRVTLTNPQSLARFMCYWTLTDLFSGLNCGVAMRFIASAVRLRKTW